MPKFLSPKELAAQLEVSVDWVYKRIRSGEVRAGRLGGLWRIPDSEVIRIERQLRAQYEEVPDHAAKARGR